LFQKKYKMQAGNIIGTGSYIPTMCAQPAGMTPERRHSGWSVPAGVELAVDTETGHVRITKLVNVADVGQPINPRIVETQLSGAAIMQIVSPCRRRSGLMRGRSQCVFADYKIRAFSIFRPI